MNELTKKLLAEGYTKDNHPDYVKWYDNMHEFEYTSEFLSQSTWQAPCGVMRKGPFTHSYTCFGGVDWRIENNNYNFACPYRKKECEHWHPILKKLNMAGKCSWQMTDTYDYNNSAEKIEDERKRQIGINLEKKFGHPGMIHCNCCHIDQDTLKPYFNFNPSKCINFMRNGCNNKVCYCTKKERDLTLANIYYDVKTTTEIKQGFIVKPVIQIIKGKKLFEARKAMTDLELYLKVYPNVIQEREESRHSSQLFFSKYHGKKFELEVLNIRIEKRESRDLLQDLEDIRNGIEVIHESDSIKKQKERRDEREQIRISKLESKILKVGYDGLSEIDQYRVYKSLDEDRILELEDERLKPKELEPEQVMFGDYK